MDFVEIKVHFVTDAPVISEMSSAIRGLWGRSLRRIYCIQRSINCDNCPFYNCNYFTIFEKKYGDYEQYHPYIIRFIESFEQGFIVSFKFFGFSCANIDKLLLSILNIAGQNLNIGGRRYDIQIESITERSGIVLYKKGRDAIYYPRVGKIEYQPRDASSCAVRFMTPYRQKYQGNLMREFEFEPFAKSLIKRVRYLDQYFNNSRLGLPQFIDIDGVQISQKNMTWVEKPRKSFRQQAKMSFGGLMGSVTLHGLSPEMYGIILLGGELHSGKQCSFGNGFYHLG